MKFAHPSLLWLLPVLVPGLAALLWWAWKRKKWLISQFVQSRLLAQLTVGVSARRQKLRLILLVATVTLILLAVARPQWGFSYEEARQRGLDIVVAIDTSNSMLASDVPPNRLERARLAVLDLLRLARTDRLGLVAFAGTAFLQCPLTTDNQAFQQSLQALNTSIIPQGGTALSEAIRAAQTAFEKDNDNYKVLILFTDGEDHDGQAIEAAEQAQKQGLRIFTVGVGTANGELIRDPNASGTQFLKDAQGQVVKSRLNESLLRSIAESAQGFYLLLSGADTMNVLYERGLAPLPKSEIASRQIKRWHERYQWFLALALALLVLEMLIPEQKHPRVQPSSPDKKAQHSPPMAAHLPLFLLAALTALLTASPLAGASVKEAQKKWQRGDYTGALIQYERLLKDSPQDARLHFNAGTAAFHATNYVLAEQHFQSALLSEDIQLQARAYYNLGNTFFRLAAQSDTPQDRLAAWNKAISFYDNCLKLDDQDQDAQFNKDVVQQHIDDLHARLERAKLAKARAESLIQQRQYQQALALMEQQYQLDPAHTPYEDFIERLRQINQIAHAPANVPPTPPAP